MNSQEYYNHTYRQQFDKADKLIDLSAYTAAKFILVDCCGWHYKKVFPADNIVSIEKSMWSNVADFTFSDDRPIQWPQVDITKPTLVFDRSTILRYLAVEEFSAVLEQAVDSFKPERILVRANTVFIDDNRLTDRIHNLHKIQVNGYVVERFLYDTTLLEISFKEMEEFQST